MPTTRPADSFAASLRSATAERHSRAEHSEFMTRLMGGELDAASYGLLLGQYLHIYRALETVARKFRAAADPVTEPFVLEGLDRTDAIRSDLAALQDGRPGTEPEALPATQEYVAQIRTTSGSPERFLAHHYLRYLGDLSGGQAVAALMARHYGIPAEALSMYRFPDLPKPKVFKDQYRDLLDAAPLSAEQRQDLKEEALAGFDLNSALFADLDRAVAARA